jgi:hypothetical protein
MPRSQMVIGQMMVRGGVDRINLDASCVLTFVEFAKEFEDSKGELRKWIEPVVQNLEQLERHAVSARAQACSVKRRGGSVESAREDGRAKVGSRPYFVQSALLDVINFLDPYPRCKVCFVLFCEYTHENQQVHGRRGF